MINPQINETEIIHQMFSAYQKEMHQQSGPLIELLQNDLNVKILKTWLDAHPKEVKISPMLTSLNHRFNPTSDYWPSALYEYGVKSIQTPYKAITGTLDVNKIENLILDKDVARLEEYFNKYPEELFKHSELLKFHLSPESGLLQMKEFLPILNHVATRIMNDVNVDPAPYYPFYSEPEKKESILGTFNKE